MDCDPEEQLEGLAPKVVVGYGSDGHHVIANKGVPQAQFGGLDDRRDLQPKYRHTYTLSLLT